MNDVHTLFDNGRVCPRVSSLVAVVNRQGESLPLQGDQMVARMNRRDKKGQTSIQRTGTRKEYLAVVMRLNPG